MYQRIVPLAIVLCAFGSADILSQGERDFATQTLQETRKQFLEAVTDLSERQWNFKPGPDRWSIGEIAEHLALTEDRLFHDVLNSLKKNAPDPGSRKPTDEAVMKFMTDRNIKAQAPAYLQPSHAANRKTLVVRFMTSRDRSIAFIKETTADLRHHYTVGPLGPMDAY